MKIKIMNDKPILKSIYHIRQLESYIEGMTYDDFVSDELCIDACITKLTQIGEMERRIDKSFKDSHNEINWRDINGLRNVVVHNYDSIDYFTIWETVTIDIPVLEDMYINLLKNDFEYSIGDINDKIKEEYAKVYKKREEAIEDKFQKESIELEDDLEL